MLKTGPICVYRQTHAWGYGNDFGQAPIGRSRVKTVTEHEQQTHRSGAGDTLFTFVTLLAQNNNMTTKSVARRIAQSSAIHNCMLLPKYLPRRNPSSNLSTMGWPANAVIHFRWSVFEFKFYLLYDLIYKTPLN